MSKGRTSKYSKIEVEKVLYDLISNTSDGDVGYAVNVLGKRYVPEAIVKLEKLDE